MLNKRPRGRPRLYANNAARCRAYRQRQRVSAAPVVNTITGDNGDLLKVVSQLYLKDHGLVADLTYGRGVMWSKVNVHRFRLIASDRYALPVARVLRQASLFGYQPHGVRADFTALLYRAAVFDVCVIDPPYAHTPGAQFLTEDRYRNSSTRGLYHADILQLYRRAMAEAYRVLTPGGTAWVKTKNEIESGTPTWSLVELHAMALAMGYTPRDLFVLVPSARLPTQRWTRQLHARKMESYLWVFEKP
jgi:hypothetical protein